MRTDASATAALWQVILLLGVEWGVVVSCDHGIMREQDHGLETGMDMQLIPRCAPALPFGNAKPVPVYIEEEAINTQRAIGTTLSHEVPVLAVYSLSSLFAPFPMLLNAVLLFNTSLVPT